MNTLYPRIQAFWTRHSPRERALMTAAIVVVVLGLGYGLIVEPLIKANAKLAASLPKQRAELRLMRVQLSEIERMRGQNKASTLAGSTLIHAIESAAAAHGVREAVTSLAPLASDRVRIVTGPIAVTAWNAWFTDLERQGISVVSCRLSSDGKAGRISVEAILAGGAR